MNQHRTWPASGATLQVEEKRRTTGESRQALPAGTEGRSLFCFAYGAVENQIVFDCANQARKEIQELGTRGKRVLFAEHPLVAEAGLYWP